MQRCRSTLCVGLHGAWWLGIGVEGDLIDRVRSIVGPLLSRRVDPHAIYAKRVRLTPSVLYKEFPHRVVERAEDLLNLVLATLGWRVKRSCHSRCRQIQSYPTTLPLMRAFVAKIKA